MIGSFDIPLKSGADRSVRVELDTAGNAELAVVLPGLRFGHDKPLLKEVTKVFKSHGCDVLKVTFNYADDPAFLNAEDVYQFAQIASDGCDIIGHATTLEGYQRVWIIGKSLGTLSMGAAFTTSHFPAKQVFGIWLTPSLLETPLLDQLLVQETKSLVLLGTEDPSNLAKLTQPIAVAPNIALHIVPGANHAFEHIEGGAASRRLIDEAKAIVTRWVHSIAR